MSYPPNGVLTIYLFINYIEIVPISCPPFLETFNLNVLGLIPAYLAASLTFAQPYIARRPIQNTAGLPYTAQFPIL